MKAKAVREARRRAVNKRIAENSYAIETVSTSNDVKGNQAKKLDN